MDIEVVEVVPGELDVRADGRSCRVLVPAGVGVPGLDDEDLAGGVVVELLTRGVRLPDVIDVSALLRTDPGLLDAVATRFEADG